MRPFIGITCGIFRDRDWCPPAILLRKTYTDAILAAGGVPLVIPVVEDEAVLRALYERIDGLLISGGLANGHPDGDKSHRPAKPGRKPVKSRAHGGDAQGSRPENRPARPGKPGKARITADESCRRPADRKQSGGRS